MNITRIKCTGKHGPEEFHKIYKSAYDVGDPNKENYNSLDAELSWQKWIYFYSVEDILFCGLRDYGSFARIFDRFFVFPKYRRQGLSITSKSNNDASYSVKIVSKLVDDCLDVGKVPFVSIQERRKRNALVRACDEWNGVINNHKFKMLPGLYCTVPDNMNDEKCWQNIATLDGQQIDLPRRE